MNKIVVITGASSGIGLNLAKLFDLCNFTVVCLNRTNPENLPNFIKCDLSIEQDITSAAEIIKEKYKSIDILINNAGYGLSGALELLPTNEIRKLFDVNLFGAIKLTNLLLPSLSCGSKVVNISSACALFALPYRAAYCASKAALSMYSYGLRMELDSSKIKVVTVCAGDIKTNFSANRIKINSTNNRYGDSVKNSAEHIDKRENKRMDALKASKKIFKIALKKNKAMYIIGGKYKFLAFMQRILPTNTFLKLTNKMFNK